MWRGDECEEEKVEMERRRGELPIHLSFPVGGVRAHYSMVVVYGRPAALQAVSSTLC